MVDDDVVGIDLDTTGVVDDFLAAALDGPVVVIMMIYTMMMMDLIIIVYIGCRIKTNFLHACYTGFFVSCNDILEVVWIFQFVIHLVLLSSLISVITIEMSAGLEKTSDDIFSRQNA